MVQMKDIISKPKIEQIEELLLLNEGSPVECTTTHRFSEGVYVREIIMPEDSIILGAKHTTTHFNIISQGACLLIDIDTKEQTYIQAPYTFESKAGVQKLLYILTDCVWSTVHVTNETDVEVLESQLIELSPTYKQIVGDKFIPGGRNNVNVGIRNNGCSRNGVLNNGGQGSS